MKNTKIDAVLFDYDGVLMDSMEDNFKAWQNTFSKYGKKIQRNDYMQLEGMSPKDIVRNICGKYGIEIKYLSNIISNKEKFYRINNNTKPYRGVSKLLRKLKRKGLKLALVSGALEERIRSVSSSTFLSLFDVIVTADIVANSKPHPEPYQKAIKKLRVTPKRCIVVENSPLGITSAKAAGVYCIAVCSTLPRRFLTQADETVTDVISLQRRLGELTKTQNSHEKD